MNKEKVTYLSLIAVSIIAITIALAYVYLPLINQLLAPGNKTTSEINEITTNKDTTPFIANDSAPVVTVVNSPIPTTSSIPVVVLKDFNSTKYPVSFKYPETMGDAKIETKSDYFNDEFVTFTNSSITIQYPIFEGGVPVNNLIYLSQTQVTLVNSLIFYLKPHSTAQINSCL